MLQPRVGRNHLKIGYACLVAASPAFLALQRISDLYIVIYSSKFCTIKFSTKCSTFLANTAVSLNCALCVRKFTSFWLCAPAKRLTRNCLVIEIHEFPWIMAISNLFFMI